MNKQRKIWIVLLVLFTSVFLLTLFINIYMVNSTKSQIVSINNLDEANDIDAIIVLGCRVYEDNTPSLMLIKRLEKGIDVYNKLNTKIIVTGDHDNNGYDEVDVMKDYLLNSNIISNDIYLDYEGFTTYDSIYRAKNVFNLKKVVIITQKYHMYRALYLANKLDLDAIGVVADDIPQKMVMLKNNIREILSRDKNFFKGIIKPSNKYQSNLVLVN